MTNEGTTLVEPPATSDATDHDLGFHEGYEDMKRDALPKYTLMPGGVVEDRVSHVVRQIKITDFIRGYIAGFVKAHEDTYG